MKFYSTNNRNLSVDFRTAVINSLPKDGGLYFPQFIPQLEDEFISNIQNKKLEEIAFEVMRFFTGDEIDEESLFEIVAESINFEFPIREIEKGIFVLELFHGPTWAFKDVGARFLARTLGYFFKNSDNKVTILVATSGDTGGAVASGFYNVPNTEVIILFPKGKVSDVQEMQLTTWGGNIKAIEVDGTFDDCQKMVKEAFKDSQLCDQYNITSANSINVARLLPQTFYYLSIFQKHNFEDLVIAVPSGNYGNLTAGLVAQKMGLPISKFIAASNRNRIVPDYLETGVFQPKPSVETYSNAMDVGNPSNFVRILELFENDYQKIKETLSGFWMDDKTTLSVIRGCYEKTGYILDPHGSIGFKALKESEDSFKNGLFLETAHPVKFLPVLDKIEGVKADFSEKVKELKIKNSHKEKIRNDFADLKKFMLDSS